MRHSDGAPSVNWCYAYVPADFDGWAITFAFVRDLRIPIPLPLALSEIASYNLFGSELLVTRFAYRAALVLSFVLAIYLAAPPSWKRGFSVLLSIVFLWCTVLVHPGNPQLYDIFFPFFFLAYTVLLLRIIREPCSLAFRKGAAVLCFVAGFALSMTEFMRPFMIFLLPLLLLGAWQSLRSRPRSYFLCLVAPVILFSGIWHVHLFCRHGQVVSSNHSGYNLIRAWPMVERPELIPESVKPGSRMERWAAANSPEHFENSQRLQKAVLQHVAENPASSLLHGLKLVRRFFAPQIDLYGSPPDSPAFLLYGPFVWAAALWLAVSVALLGIRMVRHPLPALGRPENMLVLTTVLSILIMALGEDGEQARFLVSVLPMLAVLPCCRTLDPSTEDGGSSLGQSGDAE